MGYKILQIGKYYFAKGGIETVTQSLVAALQNSKSTDVLCFGRRKQTITTKIGKSIIWESGCFLKISTAPISFSFFSRFKKIRDNYDIILIHAPNPLASIALWLFKCKAKVIVQWHGDILNKGLLYILFRFFEKKMLDRADLVLSTTDIYIEHSRALKRVAFKTKAIPLGIDENKLKSDPTSVNKIKYLHKDKRIVFSLGRFVYFKGFEYLIEAAKYLNDDIVILIGGTGRLEKSFEQTIRVNNLDKRVFIIPENGQNDWGDYYEACDVFCLPSIEKSESFGLVLLEAMSFSKPIIATNIHGSGTSWVNVDGVTGYNVSPKNSKQLAEAIIRIINSDKYTLFCKNARKRFESNFTYNIMIKNMIESFEKLLHLKPA